MSTPRPADGDDIRERRLRDALHARADEVTVRDLERSWTDVVNESERPGGSGDPVDLFGAGRGAHRRRGVPMAAAAAVAAAVIVVGGLAVAGLHRGATTTPRPAGRSLEATPVPGVTPSERSRGEIPWATVGQGWTAATWATGAAATDRTTLYLVSPSGIRYAAAEVAPRTTVLDTSPDGRRILTTVPDTASATAPQPPSVSEWDVAQGTSRAIPLAADAAPFTTSVRYTKPSGHAILIEYVQAVTQQPVIERRGLDGTLQLRYPAIKGLRTFLGSSPLATPDGLDFVVSTQSGMALVGNAQGTLVRSYPLPRGIAYCSPVSWWSAGILLARCAYADAGRSLSDLWTFPVSGAPAERRTILAAPGGTGAIDVLAGWPTPVGTLVVQRRTDGPDCPPTEVSVVASADSRPMPFVPVLPASVGPAGGAVPVTVQGRFAFLAVRGCDRAGDSLVAYDLVDHTAHALLGPGVNGGTVVSSVTIDPGR